MIKLTRGESVALLELAGTYGNCRNTEVDMTPSGSTAAIEAAKAVCNGCVASEACYVYSTDIEAGPVYAANLSEDQTKRLDKIMRSRDLVAWFVASQVTALKTK